MTGVVHHASVNTLNAFRSSPSFVLSAIRHIHEAHSSHSVAALLRSLCHVINLTSTQLDSVDFSALLFILHHSDGVKLNLLWTSIPAESSESLLFALDKVSQLRSDIADGLTT